MDLEVILVWAGAGSMILSTVINFFLNYFAKNPNDRVWRAIACVFSTLCVLLYIYPAYMASRKRVWIVLVTCLIVMVLAVINIIVMWMMGNKLALLQKQEEEEQKAMEKSANSTSTEEVINTISNANRPNPSDDNDLASLVKTPVTVAPTVPLNEDKPESAPVDESAPANTAVTMMESEDGKPTVVKPAAPVKTEKPGTAPETKTAKPSKPEDSEKTVAFNPFEGKKRTTPSEPKPKTETAVDSSAGKAAVTGNEEKTVVISSTEDAPTMVIKTKSNK